MPLSVAMPLMSFGGYASDGLLEELHEDALSRFFTLLPNQKGLDDRITEVLKARGGSPRVPTFWEKYFPSFKKGR